MFNLTAPLLLGLLGSLHCVGMCGPIALALPVNHFEPIKKHLAILLYNFGRTISYVLLGGIVGNIGELLVMSGFQRWLSIVAGAAILVGLIIKYTAFVRIKPFGPFVSFINYIKSKLSHSLRQKSTVFFAITGFLNGLLPCGLVYMALTAATAQGNLNEAIWFMFIFGMSTWPIMASMPYLINVASTKFRSGINQAMPYVLGLMAILILVRGLNLGIPYLSPKFIAETKEVNCCHKPKTAASDYHCKPK
jgi:sulfite exporter TauE/SafE